VYFKSLYLTGSIAMERKLVSFDWGIKKILRSKANFVVLEGFLSELLHDDIKIKDILESESNKEHAKDKYNRVDLLVRNSKDELIIIEVQFERQADYLHRILYGTSKIITEHIGEGDLYSEVKKVISVSIVYFDIGQGTDYIYKGTTSFIGIHNHETLQLAEAQKLKFDKKCISDIFPEYYLLKLNNFNDIAKDTLDEWIYFFKNSSIKDNFKARGIKEAKKVLDIAKLSDRARKEYSCYVESLHDRASYFDSSFGDGLRKGRKEQAVETARVLKSKGIDDEIISSSTGLAIEEIRQL
jgi:predicted transposase/invertase (TIGR01784 family)